MPTIGPERLQPRMLEMHLRRIFEFTERGAADPMFYTFFLESTFCVQRVLGGICDDLARQYCYRTRYH